MQRRWPMLVHFVGRNAPPVRRVWPRGPRRVREARGIALRARGLPLAARRAMSTKGPSMTWRTWIPMAAAMAMSGCVAAPSENVATASEELSVLDWGSDRAMAWHTSSSSEPAIAGVPGVALAVYPQGYIDDHYTYLYWNIATSSVNNYQWQLDPTLMVPHASSTARPTLVAFNGFFYVFYASGVDQYYARFNPQNRQWTGSSLLPFTGNGALAAAVFN